MKTSFQIENPQVTHVLTPNIEISKQKLSII